MPPIDPLTSAVLTIVLVGMMFCAWLLTVIPPCNDEGCVASHRKHTVAAMVASIERNHEAFHGESQPDPRCARCAARKRDKDAGS